MKQEQTKTDVAAAADEASQVCKITKLTPLSLKTVDSAGGATNLDTKDDGNQNDVEYWDTFGFSF